MKFEDLGLAVVSDKLDVYVNDTEGNKHTIAVKTYLPIEEKAKLVQYVVDCALDESTGCFSPIRLNVYFALGIMNYYTDVEIDTSVEPQKTYDLLESNGVVDRVLAILPDDERSFIAKLVDDTVEDIARYNSSFAGVIHTMTGDASNLGASVEEILSKIKNREGLELLGEIKNVVGTD